MSERSTPPAAAAFAHELARRLAEATQALSAARRALDDGRPTSAAIELDRIEDRLALAGEIAADLSFACGDPDDRPVTAGRARLSAVASEWLDETRHLAALAGVTVEGGQVPDAHVEADVAKLHRLLKHLAHVAVADGAGALQVSVQASADGPGRTALTFDVARVSRDGARCEAAAIHEALARRVAASIGARVERVTDGALVHVRAVVSGRALQPPPESGATPALGGGRVLVVEDDLDARAALSLLLEDWGFEVVAAGSGEEALAAFDAGIRLALLDVELPGVSGPEVHRLLRQRRASLPAIFLSGSERAADPGDPLVRALLKPVDLDALESSVASLLAAAPACERVAGAVELGR